MKRFLASNALMPMAILGFLMVLSPPSLALAVTGGQDHLVTPVVQHFDGAYNAFICVQWNNETRCSSGEPHKGANNSVFITASAQPAPVAPWHLVMLFKVISPHPETSLLLTDCKQRAQCQVSVGPFHDGSGKIRAWSCITDAAKDLTTVCSKAGPHAILSNQARI